MGLYDQLYNDNRRPVTAPQETKEQQHRQAEPRASTTVMAGKPPKKVEQKPSFRKTVSQSTARSTGQSIGRSISQSTEQSTEQPSGQQIEQPIRPPVGQLSSRVVNRPKAFYITERLDRKLDEAVRYFQERHGLHKVDRSTVVNAMLDNEMNWTEQELDLLVGRVIRQLTSRLVSRPT